MMTLDSNPEPNAPEAYEHCMVLRDDRDFVQEFQQTIAGELQELGWDEASAFAVRLSLEEALTNAFRHGNQSDPAKTVRVHYSIAADRIAIAVEDQGTGFDHQAVPDPTADANLEIPSGRGIMLIRAYMSSVGFVPPGNRLEMSLTRGE